MIGALDTEGMYAYMVVRGAVTWEIFVFFIHRVAELLLSYGELENTYFVFDNARSHTCKNAGNFLDGRVHYRFQPPYSPQINPIESAWAKVKKLVYSGTSPDETTFLRGLLKAMQSLTPQDCLGYHRLLLRNLQKCYFQEDLI